MKSFALLFAFISAFSIPINQNQSTKLVEFSGTVVSEIGEELPGVSIWIDELNIGTATNLSGEFTMQVKPGSYEVEFSYVGFEKLVREFEITDKGLKNQIIELTANEIILENVIDTRQEATPPPPPEVGNEVEVESYMNLPPPRPRERSISFWGMPSQSHQMNTEEYDEIVENGYQVVQMNPLSTFSIDVDGASYSNVRRMIMDGYLPPADAVRIEEMINYFNYDYEGPTDEHPFAIHTELTSAPWNDGHQLVRIGIQGEKIDAENLPASNLVFLLDVSGSMDYPDKLPLLKKGFRLLVNQLDEDDRVSIVVYAGSSGLVLPPTSGDEKEKILEAIDNLRAGGSTAGAAGIQLAYETAKENFRDDANNRVILATDGDFNVGISSDKELVDFIENKRDDGIFLSVLGFGGGNLKDSKMEKIANHGNGNYYYIDNLLEAKKVLVSEIGGTLHTIAKDVKIQVEFNPSQVQAYRLIGYENRMLEHYEFNDDTKDAGELGSGHTVTALYEVVPVGVEFDASWANVDQLKYQEMTETSASVSDEILTVKFRYKKPDQDKSILISRIVNHNNASSVKSADLSFASSVAMFGFILRNSEYKQDSNFELIKQYARDGLVNDDRGYRAEFLRMVELAELLYQGNSSRD